MGLIKSIVGAAGGVLADSWRDFFYCDSDVLNENTLAVKGQKRISSQGRSSNTKGEDNIISNGSVIAVNEGQCMIIVESGEIVEVCAEPGQFVYDTSTEPSIFYGGLGEGIKNTFIRIGQRFTFGGDTGKDQRIYFFNIKEIYGNKYGTSSPIPFRVVDANLGLDLDSAVRLNGEYSYKLVDPLLFYKNVCGNVEAPYTRDRIDSQMKSELLTALQPALARISEIGVRYSAIPAHTAELADFLNDELSEDWRERRGIEVAVFGINSITLSEEDEARIKNLQQAAVLRDPNMAAANIAAATSDAMRDAANNQNGAIGAFMGMGMAGNMGGGQAAQMFQQGGGGYQQQPQNAYGMAQGGGFGSQPFPQQGAAVGAVAGAVPADGWACPQCGTQNAGNFCMQCGTKKPEPEPAPAGWFCPQCGTQNAGNFCMQCGTPKPQQ